MFEVKKAKTVEVRLLSFLHGKKVYLIFFTKSSLPTPDVLILLAPLHSYFLRQIL